MARKFLKSVYDLSGETAVRDYYDGWAATYDAEVAENGYATPGRCAAALAATGIARDGSLLDMGCGTGLSGAAFQAAGFTVIDGCDLSAGMLAQAEARGVYRALYLSPDLPEALYDAAAAVGVIGAGAGPPELLDTCLAHVKPGGHVVFSFNDSALDTREYPAKLQAVQDHGTARLISQEHGAHLPGIDMRSVVYVLQKQP